MIKIIFHIIVFGFIAYGIYLSHTKIVKLNKTIKSLNYVSFSVDVLKPEFYKLVKFLKNKKTRLSSEDKIEIYTQWNKILLLIPLEYQSYIYNEFTPDEIKNNDMSSSDRKWKVIDLIEDLIFKDDVDLDLLKSISFHMYFIMM